MSVTLCVKRGKVGFWYVTQSVMTLSKTNPGADYAALLLLYTRRISYASLARKIKKSSDNVEEFLYEDIILRECA